MTVPHQLLPRQWLLPKLLSRDRVAAQIATFVAALDAGRPYRVTVEEAKSTRNDEQNAALWGLAYKILEQETGNDPEDLHVYFCGEFWGWTEYVVMNQTRKRPRRTTTRNEDGKRDVVSKVEFAEFFSFIQRRSAETVGIYIPDPDPNYRQAQAHG